MSTTTTNYSLVKYERGAEPWNTGVNNNFDSIDTLIKAINDKLDAFNTNTNLVNGGYNSSAPATAAGLIGLEVDNARGSFSNLSTRLNRIQDPATGDLLSTTATNQWLEVTATGAYTRVSATNFTVVAADYTTSLQPGTRIKLTVGGSDYFYNVRTSKYTGGTTNDVTIWDTESIPAASITNVYYSFQQPSELKDDSAWTPGAGFRALEDCDADYLYFATYTSTSTGDEALTGANVAKTGAGHLGRIEYESGLFVVFKYSASTAAGNVASARFYLASGTTPVARGANNMTPATNCTLIKTITYTYDGTTGFITDAAMVRA